MNSPGITTTQPQLYLMPGCGICHQVKSLLERHDIPVGLCWVTEPRHEHRLRQLLKNHTGRRSVPFLFVAGEMVQGFERGAIRAMLSRAMLSRAMLSRAMLSRAGFQFGDESTHGAINSDEFVRIPHNAFWVANFLNGSLSFVDPGSRSAVAEELASIQAK